MRISDSEYRKVRAGLAPNREGHEERNFGYACATQKSPPKAFGGPQATYIFEFCESFAFQHEALT